MVVVVVVADQHHYSARPERTHTSATCDNLGNYKRGSPKSLTMRHPCQAERVATSLAFVGAGAAATKYLTKLPGVQAAVGGGLVAGSYENGGEFTPCL